MVRSVKRSAFLERLRILMRVNGARPKLSRRTLPYLRCNAERIGSISCAVCDWRNMPLHSFTLPPAQKEAGKTASGDTARENRDRSHSRMPLGVRAVRMAIRVVTRHSGVIKTAGTVQARVHRKKLTPIAPRNPTEDNHRHDGKAKKDSTHGPILEPAQSEAQIAVMFGEESPITLIDPSCWLVVWDFHSASSSQERPDHKKNNR
jgi:hypothetical protein